MAPRTLQPKSLRLLAIFASPKAGPKGIGPPHGPPLNLLIEWTRLRAGIVRTKDPFLGYPLSFYVYRCYPQSDHALKRSLSAKYDIIHCGCHSDGNGLYFEDALGRERYYSKEDLAVELKGSGVKLLVLIACNSFAIGEYLVEKAKVVDNVIVTTKPISDFDSETLSHALYYELSSGRSVRKAVDQAASKLPLDVGLTLIGDGKWAPEVDIELSDDPVFIEGPRSNSLFPLSMEDVVYGRDAELHVIGQFFERPRLVMALTGIDGVGKGVLAAYAGLRFNQYFDTIAYADVIKHRKPPVPRSTGASAEEAPSPGLECILLALQRTEDSSDVLRKEVFEEAVGRRLRRGRVLLLIGNADALGEDEARLLCQVLQGVQVSSGSKVLLTMQQREHPFLTATLGAECHEVGKLGKAAAVRVLYEALRRNRGLKMLLVDVSAAKENELAALRDEAGVGAEVTLATVAKLAELAKDLFENPQLLILTAGEVAQWGYDGALQRLRARPTANNSVTAHIDKLVGSMVDGLAAKDPRALHTLYAALPFAGGAEEERLASVAGVPELVEFQDQYLGPALRSSLLSKHGERYELEGPVGVYLHRRAAAKKGSLDELHHRHAASFLEVARKHRTRAAQVAQVDPWDWDNIGVALNWLATQMLALGEDGDGKELAQLLVDYALCWQDVLLKNEPVRRLDIMTAALTAAQSIKRPDAAAEILEALGDIYLAKQDFPAAITNYRAALAIHEEIGASLGILSVTTSLAELYRALAKTEQEESKRVDHVYEAFFYRGEALDVLEAREDLLGQAQVQEQLAELHLLLGQEDAAEECRDVAARLRAKKAALENTMRNEP